MSEDGSKSKLLSKFSHLFSKEESREGQKEPSNTVVEKPANKLKIGKLVLPDQEAVDKPLKNAERDSAEPVESELEEGGLDIQFAQNLSEVSGKFIYCETICDMVQQIHSLKAECNWEHIYAWESELLQLLIKNGFQEGVLGYTSEDCNAAVSLCEYLIADTGNILLSSKQATRRQLPVFPKTHLIIADNSQLKSNLKVAIESFKKKFKDELPSIINLSKEPRSLLENHQVPVLESGGPKDIYVFFTDEILQ